MADFSKYGGKSDEWLALEKTLPAPPTNISPEDLKRTTNETRSSNAQEEMKILRPKVSTQDFQIPTRDNSTIEARTYRPSSVSTTQKLPIYIHFHGGGFFFGTIGSEDATCTRMALDVGIVVVNVNYRHTPEFIYPIAWNDAEDAFQWVYDNAEQSFAGDNMNIVVGGVSAGAYLTASLMLKLAIEESSSRMGIQGAVYMIPPLVHHDYYQAYLDQLKDPGVSSWKENESAPILPVSRIEFFNSMLFPDGPPGKDDRRANPGLATVEEVKKLPPATFGICGLDPLRDE